MNVLRSQTRDLKSCERLNGGPVSESNKRCVSILCF